MNRVLLIVLIFISAPIGSIADHDCIDGREIGYKIPLKKVLPKKWLTIGGKLINDAELHALLRKKYSKYYTSGKDSENFIIDRFCGVQDGVYILIRNGDFGPFAEFSKVPPKCFTCKQIEGPIPILVSRTGLKIGQNKEKVSAILGYKINMDITSIEFMEIEKKKSHKVWHSQTLRVEFKDNVLIRFSIDDYRERYD